MTRRRKAAIIASIVTLLAAAIAWSSFRGSTLDHALASLDEALADEPYRSIEPRFSTSRSYRPFRPQPGEPSLALRAAASMVLAQATTSANDQALAHLISGSVRESVAALQNANKDGSSAAILSDSCAALLVAARINDDPLAVVDALSACDQALALDPSRLEPLFNRALALRDLGLLAEAREAFRRYCDSDADSDWGHEAMAIATALHTPTTAQLWQREKGLLTKSVVDDSTIQRLAKQFPQQMRVHAEAVWPAEWAEAVRQGNPSKAAASLALARRAARALRGVNGEALADEAIGVINRASQPYERDALVSAYLAYRKGRIAHSNNNPTVAERALREAASRFADAQSPMQYVARYYVGSALFEQHRLNEVSSVLDELALMRLGQRGYHALDGQIGWERGATAVMRGAFSDAFDTFAQARAELEQLGESDLVASLDVLSAGAHDLARQQLPAWRARRAALVALSRSGNRQRAMLTVENGATAVAIRQEWRRVLALSRVAGAMAEALDHKLIAAHALTQQAAAHARLGNISAARMALARARVLSSKVSDERHRSRIDAEAAFAEALLTAKSDPAMALAKLDEARRYAERSGDRLALPRIAVEKARARRRLGDNDGALRALEEELVEIERQRGAVRDLQQRAEMFSAANELFDEAFSLTLAVRDPGKAFAMAERQRSRALLDAFALGSASTTATTSPLSHEAIRQALAADAVLVSYRATESSVAVFVVRPSGLTLTPLAVPRAALLQAVSDFRRAVSESNRATNAAPTNGTWTNATRQLRALLIDPIAPQLASARQIAFIPEPEFASLSFATLLQDSGIEPEVILQAPSATLAIECSRRAAIRDGDSTLAIGGSVIDRDRYSDLPILPAVAREARAVAAAHTRSLALVDGEATPSAVRRELPHYAIAHFAAHALSGRGSAADARLVLASERGNHGELRAADIASTPLPRTHLVILAACGSGESSRSGDGVVSLATAFLQAGVPTVVAAMWSAEDATTARVMASFHRRLRSENAPAALRASTRDATTGGRVLQGGLTIIGGIRGFVRDSSKKGEGK